MKKKKNKLSLYNKRQVKQTIFKVLHWVLLIGGLIMGVLCLYYALKNSFGNMANLIDLLDNKKWTGEQLSENYSMLIEKYGEWVIGSGSTGFTIKFINVKKVFFSGFMMLNLILSVIGFVLAFIGGKVCPNIVAMSEKKNQDMTNKATLEIQEALKK